MFLLDRLVQERKISDANKIMFSNLPSASNDENFA